MIDIDDSLATLARVCGGELLTTYAQLPKASVPLDKCTSNNDGPLDFLGEQKSQGPHILPQSYYSYIHLTVDCTYVCQLTQAFFGASFENLSGRMVY